MDVVCVFYSKKLHPDSACFLVCLVALEADDYLQCGCMFTKTCIFLYHEYLRKEGSMLQHKVF